MFPGKSERDRISVAMAAAIKHFEFPGMCGFKGKVVMNSGINDTARCALATAHITAVNCVCNGVVFQARV